MLMNMTVTFRCEDGGISGVGGGVGDNVGLDVGDREGTPVG